jgi:post-segregation antitoxin (ccd killing protein)
MAKRTAINVYVPADLHDQLKGSGLNYSQIARDAWFRALAERDKLAAEYGPAVPVASGPYKRPYSRRWAK